MSREAEPFVVRDSIETSFIGRDDKGNEKYWLYFTVNNNGGLFPMRKL